MECTICKLSWAIRKPEEKQKVADNQKANFLSTQQSLYQQSTNTKMWFGDSKELKIRSKKYLGLKTFQP